MTLYVLRAVMVSLSQFVLLYVGLRLAVEAYWRLRTRYKVKPLSSRLLFLLQVGPFALSMVLVGILTVPSFIRHEPIHADEGLGLPLFLLSTLACLLFGAGIVRATHAALATSVLVRAWKKNGTPDRRSCGLHIINTGPDSPPLVIAGIWKPQLFVSSAATTLLSQDELRLAIAHELQHVRRHDNLKKFLLRLCSVPSSTMERSWIASLEVAADLSAVGSKREALDLASAVVKASKLTVPTPALVMNFASDPADILRARVERLLSWDMPEPHPTHRAVTFRFATALTAAVCFAVAYPALLKEVHDFTEFLVR